MNSRSYAYGLLLFILGVLVGCGKPVRYRCVGCNVLLMVVDALRADHLPCYGYQRNTAPNISRLAERGILFEKAISQAPWTKPSIASLLSSLYPHNHKAIDTKDVLPLEITTLTEELNTNGYYTYAIQTNTWIKSLQQFNQGFDEYLEFRSTRCAANKIADLFLTFLDDMEKRHSKFFAYLHFMDIHIPYNAPEEYNSRFVDENYKGQLNRSQFRKLNAVRKGRLRLSAADKKHVINLYDAQISFVDDQVQRILDKLERLGLMENTIIILLADHGEEFWEHEGLEHGHSMYNELLRVPLILYCPQSGVNNKKVEQVIRLIDIYPTLMEILGLRTDVKLMGSDISQILFSEQEKNLNLVAFSEGLLYGNEQKALQTAYFKLIKRMETNTYEFYDLRKDPKEKLNIYERQNRLKRLNKFKRLLSQYIKSQSKTYKRTQKEIDEETKKQLKSLGYIKDQSPKKR